MIIAKTRDQMIEIIDWYPSPKEAKLFLVEEPREKFTLYRYYLIHRTGNTVAYYDTRDPDDYKYFDTRRNPVQVGRVM